MIRNLNQLTFQGFGTVPPERNQSAKHFDKHDAATIKLSQEENTVFRARTETWLVCSSGNSVLSVSHDGESYLHFYLDKPVRIKEGVLFLMSPFMGDSVVLSYAAEKPEQVGSRGTDRFRVDPQLHVESIYTFWYQEKEQGFLFPGESHPMAELTYVDQGSVHSVAEGQDLLLKQGDMVIYGPGQWHMQYSDIGVAPRFVTISFELDGAQLMPLLNRKFTAPQNVVTLLQNMLREQERMDTYSNDIILSQLNLLLLQLLRESAAPKGGKLQTSNSIHSENEIIRQAQQFISSHIREKLSVPLVARQVDVSPSYLTALFHKNLQISPGEYIRRIKLQESKQMIRENNLNFTEIAAELQYSTVHHFSRQFKEKFGITPTEYAKSVR
ncbi:MAG: helix-turn-helix transcriptional regulator [Oscillospiraceae bacterium]|nr:helix-turn-helix transcriptional regulator [Oscillospiraceae bacterium]MBQ3194348.1 helix-turn-helix transcriptional regulator [Oscillospiraceae bacterium]